MAGCRLESAQSSFVLLHNELTQNTKGLGAIGDIF